MALENEMREMGKWKWKWKWNPEKGKENIQCQELSLLRRRLNNVKGNRIAVLVHIADDRVSQPFEANSREVRNVAPDDLWQAMAFVAAEEDAAGPGRYLGRDDVGRLAAVVPTLEGVWKEEVVSGRA